VYADLLRFKQRLLGRVQAELGHLSPEVQRAAAEDLAIIEGQMEGYRARLDIWYQRLAELEGLALDSESRTVRHQRHSARLTDREFELLRFLVEHPHRYYTPEQLMARAWQGANLFPEEVRNYVLRLRKLITRMEIPYELLNRPGHGYSLVLKVDSKP
jgi:DNA-binding response OmpR family regulator